MHGFELLKRGEEQNREEGGQAMYEQTVKVLLAFDKQHFTFAMLLTSWSFSRAKPYGKKPKLLRSGWPVAAPEAATLFLNDRVGPGRFIICDLSRSNFFRWR